MTRYLYQVLFAQITLIQLITHKQDQKKMHKKTFNTMTVHEWLLTMPQDLATEAVSKTPPSMLRETSSCLSEAIAKSFVWKGDEDKWGKVYRDNMPNFAAVLMENREYLNVSAFARSAGISRGKMEDFLRNEDKHTFEFNEKLLYIFCSIAKSMGSAMDTTFKTTCQGGQENQEL